MARRNGKISDKLRYITRLTNHIYQILEFYFATIGSTCLALVAASFAAFCNLADLALRTYANRRMKRISILDDVSLMRSRAAGHQIPFLGHHKKTLNQNPLGNLRSNTFEQRHRSFMFNNVCHYLEKVVEWFTMSRCWRTRL